MIKEIIGYQIISKNDPFEMPSCFYSFEYFKDIEIAKKWLELEKSNPEHGEFRWALFPVFEDDIENPTIIEYI